MGGRDPFLESLPSSHVNLKIKKCQWLLVPFYNKPTTEFFLTHAIYLSASGAFCEMKVHTSPLLAPLVNQTLPSGLLHDLAVLLQADKDVFVSVFNPLLQGLWQLMRTGTILENRHRLPLLALQQLCETKILVNGTASRPFAQLIVDQVCVRNSNSNINYQNGCCILNFSLEKFRPRDGV